MDCEDGENTVASGRTVSVALNEDETKRLLTRVPEAYRTQIQEVLICALADVVGKWSGADGVALEVEGHGREDIKDGVDITRTVGWFTSVYPIVIESANRQSWGDKLKAVKEELRSVPSRGIGFGILKYLRREDESIESLKRIVPHIVFNYLGQFDQVLQAFDLEVARESTGMNRSPRGRRKHVIEINGGIADGKLGLNFGYSENRHKRETIETLAEDYKKALIELIDHCVAVRRAEYTPSDFKLASLRQAELDAIASERGEIEDVYPLTPMQHGVLFHTLYAPQSGVYCDQAVCTLEGNLDHQAFRAAWQEVTDRHHALRTSFEWIGVREPLQIVLKQVDVELAVEDWSELGEPERSLKLETYLEADRERGFDVRQGPLMRMLLIVESDDRRKFVWNRHHLVMDGWCMAVILREVIGVYEANTQGRATIGKVEGREPVGKYRDYIEWLRRQDPSRAEQFWRTRFDGFKQLHRLPMKQSTETTASQYKRDELRLSRDLTGSLLALSKERQVTLNTLVQAAWALLLGRYCETDDVVFGATVSGRPADLKGVENMVGLFINTLPVRVQLADDSPVADWLREIQRHQVEMREYEYSSLVDVQSWSGISRGEPLFESILIFQNYPLEDSLNRESTAILVKDARFIELTNYGFGLTATPGDELHLAVQFDATRYDDSLGTRIVGDLEAALAGFVEHASGSIADVQQALDKRDKQLRKQKETSYAQSKRRKLKEARLKPLSGSGNLESYRVQSLPDER